MNPRPRLTLVAVVSADGFISSGQGVPWDLPRDKAHFRSLTKGQWVLVGRRTYEEMIGWFGDRRVLVMTHDRHFPAPVGEVVTTVEEALYVSARGGAQNLFVLGGSGPFNAAIALADRLVLTELEVRLEAGVAFPTVSPDDWHLVSKTAFPPDPENPLAMVFATYERRKPGSSHD